MLVSTPADALNTLLSLSLVEQGWAYSVTLPGSLGFWTLFGGVAVSTDDVFAVIAAELAEVA